MAELIYVKPLSNNGDLLPTTLNGVSTIEKHGYHATNAGYNGSATTLATSKTSMDIVQNPDPTQTKLQVLKNLLLISFGFFFLFTAFSSLQNIQSSLNPNEGLGTGSLSTIYATMVVSCIFVPSYIINKIGCKWTIVVAMLMYSTYMAANFYATWYTLIPGAMVLGMGAAPLWSAKCTYLTQIGAEYATHVGAKAEVIIVRFFGIFFMIFQSGQISGNLISSVVLAPDDDENKTIISDDRLNLCGASYCNEQLDQKGNETIRPPDEKIYILCGVYVGCAVFAAILVAVFVDPLIRVGGTATGSTNSATGLKLLAATVRHLKNKKQILAIPLTMFSGLEQAFISGDYTKAFITCPLGIHRVGYVMVCYGIVDATCCVAFEPVVKKFGRVPVFVFGSLINGALATAMLTWQPDPEQIIIFYILAGFWGMSDAIWQTQINAFYGVVFANNEEAAFSNYRLWESLGFILAFAYANYLCIHHKLFVLLGVLLIGMIGYLIIEYSVFREKKQREDDNNLTSPSQIKQ